MSNLFKRSNSYTSLTMKLLPFLRLHLLLKCMLREHVGRLLQLFLSKGEPGLNAFWLSASGAKELPRVRTMREQSIITLIILSKNAQKRQTHRHAQTFLQASRKLAGTQLGKSLGSGQASWEQMARLLPPSLERLLNNPQKGRRVFTLALKKNKN